MKIRPYLIIAFLLLLFLAGAGGRHIRQSEEALAARLDETVTAIRAEDWTLAREKASALRKQWDAEKKI